MKTILNNSEAQIIEKKSKFISYTYYVTSIEEAEDKLKEIRKKYYDAKHHCFAYRVHSKEGIIEKASDDGEPSGTAGAPMLNLLVKNELSNVLVVVIRYFGGILLGTGGLVRAYTDVSKQAIENAGVSTIEEGLEMLIKLPYKDLQNFKYYCQKNQISVIEIEFGENVICKAEVTIDKKDKLIDEIVKKKFNIQNIEILKEMYIKNTI